MQGGTTGEVKREKGVREGRGLKGEGGGGRMRVKGEGGKGPESTLEKLWFWYPYDLGTLQWLKPKDLSAASKEKQHQSLHYSTEFPHEFYAVEFPVSQTAENMGRWVHRRWICFGGGAPIFSP